MQAAWESRVPVPRETQELADPQRLAPTARVEERVSELPRVIPSIALTPMGAQ